MNEKSNPMPMMYKTIPAVAELNKVPGFDPLKFLRHKVSRKTNEEIQLYGKHNVFKDIQHWHQIVVLKDEADLSSAEDSKLLVFQCR